MAMKDLNKLDEYPPNRKEVGPFINYPPPRSILKVVGRRRALHWKVKQKVRKIEVLIL